VQIQVLLLLRELRERNGLAFLFVSHDLSVVRWFCGSVAVMYLGRIVEHGPVAEVLREASPEPDPARHPAQDHRRNPLRRRTATRLHLPPPLRRGAGGMCAGRAAAGAALGWARCRLPSLQPHIRRGLTQMHGCLALMGFA
jgi:peptide/nickel transport system ATP-binding protein